MEKRDLVQAEIEKLGFFLQRLLANFLNGNSTGNSIEAADLVTNEFTNEFKNELDFDLPLFLSLSNDEMKKYLSNFKFNEQNLEKLADLLAEMNLSKAYLVRSIELLDLVDELSNSFSFERNSKKIKIQQLLNP